jgi:hypothetical protein
MLNGYSPVITKAHYDNVFKRFESANMGELSDTQLDDLTRRGVRYAVLHEDAFPEDVSPFPVCFTLKRLLNHPRLRLLDHAGRVWAFEILDAPESGYGNAPAWNVFFPARRWEIESSLLTNAAFAADAACGGAGYVTLNAPGAQVEMSPTATHAVPDLRWMVRLRGRGTIMPTTRTGGVMHRVSGMTVAEPAWQWLDIPVGPVERGCAVSLRLELDRGNIDLDTALLAAGTWHPPAAGESLTLPAPCFFHAGYTDTRMGEVVLLKDWEPDSIVFYGPKMPLERGQYRVELTFSTDAPKGTALGEFNMRVRETDESNWTPVLAGETADCSYEHKYNLPVFLAFRFVRNADMRIRTVSFTRLE